MHLQQPIFANCEVRGGPVAAELFDVGLSLPSGSSLTDDEYAEVVETMRTSSWRREGEDAYKP